MLPTKQDVDRHVIGIFKNMNSESERNLKCFRIAKHYYAVNDYKTTIKYINRYLSASSNSAAAHRLLGECYIHLNMKAKALDALKTSLELDGSQRDLVLKVCDLLVDPEVPLDVARATYWLERAESFYPKDPAVFKLKEHLLKSGSNAEKNSAQLEKLILAEVSAHPANVNVRIRLLNFFMEFKRYQVAYEHALELEDRQLFCNDLRWYNCLCNLIEEYERSTENVIFRDHGFEFFIKKITFLERRADLSMQEFQIDTKLTTDCSSAVFALDQALDTASKVKVPEAEKDFFREFTRHMGAQLCYHMATLVLKRAKKEYGIWQKAISSASPLLFLACQNTTFGKDTWYNLWLDRNKYHMDSWNKAVALRLSQAGHVLNSWSRDRRNQFLQKVTQFCGGKWRNRVYVDVFYNRNHQQAMTSSHFLNDPVFADVPLHFLSEDELASLDELSQLSYPESLHHLVWLGLVSFKPNGQLNDGFRCKVLPDLQFTVDNLFNTGPETLNQLDADAFLYASVLCAKLYSPNNLNSDKPTLLPVSISEELCTPAQADWWASVYKIYRNKGTENISEIRMKLRKGIETVRVIGQHGLHVKLIVLLAKLFQERALKSKNGDEVPGLEARSHLYWTAAIPLLEKMEKNQELRLIPNRLFDYRGKDLTPSEVKNYLEDGRLFLACRLMKQGENEAAIEEFALLKSPYAAFYQGLIYKKLALDVMNQRPESITSENRSQHVILLNRARDAFFLTLERLRSPGMDYGHPLDSQIHTHLEEIESLLARIDTDGGKNRNGEVETDESEAGVFPAYSDVDNSLNAYNNSGSLSAMNDSLPSAVRLSFGMRQSTVKSESKPSMERLDAHLRHLVEANKNELKDIKVAIQKGLMNEIKTLRNEMKGFRIVCNDILAELKKLNSENSALTKRDDTLVCSNGDDTGNISRAEQHYNNYQNYTNFRHLPTSQASSSVAYGTPIVPQVSNVLTPGSIPTSVIPNTFFSPQRPLTPADQLLLYQSLGYYTQGAPLSFADHHNLPHFRNVASPKNFLGSNSTSEMNNINTTPIINKPQQQYQGTSEMRPPSPYGGAMTNSAPVTKVAFSNSNGNKSPSQQAHAFQIPLPAQAILVKTSPLENLWPNNSQSVTTIANTEANTTVITSSPLRESSATTTNHNLNISSKSTDSYGDSDSDSRPDFTPVIPLPDEVPIVTGEEDEKKLFESRAKLLMFVNKNWVERGVGQMRVLHNENTGTARIVMRRDQVFSVCANHFILPEMEIHHSKTNDRALIWVANDYSDSESIVRRQFCVRFKTLDEAKDFQFAFERGREIAKARAEKKETPPKLESMKKEEAEWECPSCSNKYEAQVKTCSKCNANAEPEKPKFGGFTLSSSTDLKTATPKAAVKEDRTTDSSKPNPFANFTFKITTTTAESPTTASNKPLFSDSQTIRTGVTSFASIAAANAAGDAFKKDENFKGFEGTGSLVFGYLNKTNEESQKKLDVIKGNEEEEDGSGHASDFVPTAEFTPVIPLPDLVEVKTGEEDETVLYAERAKILRFVTDLKEWKERGIGIMKVLLNEKTGKIRLLMRREQVLKVCCNHFLDENMKFEPMTKNEKALTWYAQDYSEGDLKHELLALKFGKPESMQAFKKLIEDKQKEMKDGRLMGIKVVEHTNVPESNQKPLSELFKPAPGSWECPTCCLQNKEDAIKCVACESRKPGTGSEFEDKKEAKGIILDPSLMGKFSFGIPQTTATETNTNTATTASTTPSNTSSVFSGFSSKGTFDLNPKFTFGVPQASNSVTGSRESDTTSTSKNADPEKDSFVFGSGKLQSSHTQGSKEISSSGGTVNLRIGETKSTGLELTFGSAGCYNFNFSVNKPKFDPTSCVSNSPISSVFVTDGKFGITSDSSAKSVGEEKRPTQNMPPGKAGTLAAPLKDSPVANTSGTFNISSQSDDSYVESVPDPRPDFKPIIPLPDEVPVSKFGGFTLSSSTDLKTATPKAAVKEDRTTDSSKPNPFANFTFKITTTTAESPTTASNKPLFSDSQTIRTGVTSFASIAAANAAGDAFKKDENFKGFEGTGSLVFGYLNKTNEESQKKLDVIKGNEEEEDGSGHASDFVPTAEFTPVIPLPDLVEVKTGEEDETVLYAERAKILRFVTDLKEWKERGIGIMKVLLNEKTGKIRLLMRREQVLKVCCNHFLDENMKFEPMTKNEKALTWYAQDYSEGDLKHELLALKFGKPESMQAFKKLIEDKQKEMKDGRLMGIKVVEHTNVPESNQKPLSELFKPAPGSWECPTCCLQNKEDAIKCVACESRKPGTGSEFEDKKEAKGIILDPSLMGKFSFGIPQTTATETNTNTATTASTTPSNTSSVFSGFSSKGTFDLNPKFTFGVPQANTSGKNIFGGNRNIFSGLSLMCAPTDSGCEDISIVFETQATEEQRQKALDLKLPPNFFLYSNAPPCPGCRGCYEEEEKKSDATLTKTAKSETSCTTPIFGSQKCAAQTGSWGTLKFDLAPPNFSSDTTFKFGNVAPLKSEAGTFPKRAGANESDDEADEDEEEDDGEEEDYNQDDEPEEDEHEEEGKEEAEEEEEGEEGEEDEEEEEQEYEYSSFEPKLVLEKNLRIVKKSFSNQSPSKSKTWGGTKKSKSPNLQIYQTSPYEYEVHLRSASEEEIVGTKFVPKNESVVKESGTKCLWSLDDSQISIEFQTERDLKEFMEFFEGNEGEEDYHSARS